MSYTEEDFKKAVNAAFDAYDHLRIGALEGDQIGDLINDTLRHVGA